MKNEQSLQKLTPDATLSQILSTDEQAANLLSSIGLEPSNHKDETLRSVCKQRKWSEAEVMQWLKEHRKSGSGMAKEERQPKSKDFGKDLAQWSHYMEEAYHRPNLKLLQEIREDFPRVKKIHANQYPWIKNMEYETDKFLEGFRLYLKYVTEKFHPLVRKIDSSNQQVLNGTVRKLKRSLEIIDEDQHRLQKSMSIIRDKGNKFSNPDGACTTLRILNHQFKELHKNLKEQFELEREKILPLVKDKLKAIR